MIYVPLMLGWIIWADWVCALVVRQGGGLVVADEELAQETEVGTPICTHLATRLICAQRSTVYSYYLHVRISMMLCAHPSLQDTVYPVTSSAHLTGRGGAVYCVGGRPG